MPFRIDIQTNFDDENNLDIETCGEIIDTLQIAYKNIRSEMYTYFLGMRSIRIALLLAMVSGLFFFLSENALFLYGMPIIALIVMIVSLTIAETASAMVKRQVRARIVHFQQLLEVLKRKQGLNS